MADAERLTFTLSSGGDVVIKLRPDLAPGHVERITQLVEQRLLRQRHLPPRDPGLHGPGRRSDRDRHQRLGPAQPQGRIQPRAARPRHLLDGAHVDPTAPTASSSSASTTPASSTANIPCGARSRAAWSMSTRCPTGEPPREPGQDRQGEVGRRLTDEPRPVTLITGASAGLGVEFARQLRRSAAIGWCSSPRRKDRLEALAERARQCPRGRRRSRRSQWRGGR